MDLNSGLGDLSKTPGLGLPRYNVELFQHYTTVAHLTISGLRGPELWEFVVPKMAMEYPFLMHGLLSLSALHLATLNPTRRRELITKASWNESQALPSYRETMAKPNKQNIHAIFVFSGFVAQYSLAHSQSWNALDRARSRIDHEMIDDLPEFPPNWFHIIRGTSTMIYSYYMLLMQGPFGKVLTQQPDEIPFQTNPDDTYLKALEPLVLPAGRSVNPSESNASSPKTYRSSPTVQGGASDDWQATHLADLACCAKALQTLRRTFVLRFSPCGTIDNLAACYIFPGIVDKQFLRLLHKRKPEALILFAHYCVLLSYCDYSWYFYGVGKRLIAAIWRSLSVRWRPWMAWPVAVTGAIADEEDRAPPSIFGVQAWVEEQNESSDR